MVEPEYAEGHCDHFPDGDHEGHDVLSEEFDHFVNDQLPSADHQTVNQHVLKNTLVLDEEGQHRHEPAGDDCKSKARDQCPFADVVVQINGGRVAFWFDLGLYIRQEPIRDHGDDQSKQNDPGEWLLVLVVRLSLFEHIE